MKLPWIITAGAALSIALCPAAHADGADLLDGSTNAIVLGPTGIPDPAFFPGYLPTVDSLYLEPLGFSPTGTVTALITPETPLFGPSVTAGDQILVDTVEADYNAGLMSPSDPLTIVGYSQSTLLESQAEQTLYDYGIPSADLRFVMLGDPAADPASGPTGILANPDSILGTPLVTLIDDLLGWQNLNGTVTPSDLYPTDVFTVQGDFFADPVADSNPLALLIGDLEHGTYLGLSAAEIADATSTVSGMTTYYDIADPSNLLLTILTDNLNILGFGF